MPDLRLRSGPVTPVRRAGLEGEPLRVGLGGRRRQAAGTRDRSTSRIEEAVDNKVEGTYFWQ